MRAIIMGLVIIVLICTIILRPDLTPVTAQEGSEPTPIPTTQPTPSVQPQGRIPPNVDTQLIKQLQQDTQNMVTVTLHEQTGLVSFIGTTRDRPIARPAGIPVDAEPEQAARAFLNGYGSLFGLHDATQELRTSRVKNSDQGRAHVRFQQLVAGIPVLAGELIVNLDEARNVLSANGELMPSVDFGTLPTVTAVQAQQKGLDLVASQYNQPTTQLITTSPTLWIYDPKLIGEPDSPAILVWRLEISAVGLTPIREFVLVDAHQGTIALHFNQVEMALNRRTHTANNTMALPGTLVCDESNPACTGGDGHAVSAHRYAADTYNFYMSRFSRDSIDGAGMTLVSTVHYDANLNNAFWHKGQMIYGDGSGYAFADDVVGHEFTHGITDYESDLLYKNESGAINESLSDIFGEFIDLTNNAGNDNPNVRWQIGEDVTSLGTIRDMRDPTRFNNPDRMSSPYYYHGTGDHGGVHTNSGVGNKAASLMTDGGFFNGFTVTGLGIDKAAAIYYEVQANLLTSGSDYRALADALQQACNNLVGEVGITAGDCWQVVLTTWATEMRAGHVATTGNDTNHCLSRDTPCRTVGAAINKVIDGGTIFVSPGVYNERLVITKRLKLTGSNAIIK